MDEALKKTLEPKIAGKDQKSLKPIVKQKAQAPSKERLLKEANSQELMNCFATLEAAAAKGKKSCYLMKESDYPLSDATAQCILKTEIDLSQEKIPPENDTSVALYTVRAYFDESSTGIKRFWQE